MDDIHNAEISRKFNKRASVIISDNFYAKGCRIGGYEVIRTVRRELFRRGWSLNPVSFGFTSVKDLVAYYYSIDMSIMYRECNFVVLRN